MDEPLGLNPRGWVMGAALAGGLRDCDVEGYSTAWPYERPEGAPRAWHSGFIFSSWQLLDVADALTELSWIRAGYDHAEHSRLRSKKRARTLALITLTTRHLPGVNGQFTTPSGVDRDAVDASRFAIDDAQRLSLVRYPASRLREDAEALLSSARSDPMIAWWPLLRHSNATGWSKLAGVSADHLWRRLGAEVLLRAHDELAEVGIVEPLPDLSASGWWGPLHDRVSHSSTAGDSLEQALGKFGLAPHPRVLLLVEGQTEFLHFTKLLRLFGLDRPDMVRLQNCHTSGAKADLITRFAVAPRLAEPRGDIQMLQSHPTALVIAMDPENAWTTPSKREKSRRALMSAIREEVEAQRDGTGRIGDEDLNFLVTIHVWGENTFEIANFTDDELIQGLTELAASQGVATHPAWTEQAATELAAARNKPNDIKVPIERLGLREEKVKLAEILWPALLAKVEDQVAWDEPTLPILRVINDVRTRVGLLLGGSYSLRSVTDV